jgi:hypothetical protein
VEGLGCGGEDQSGTLVGGTADGVGVVGEVGKGHLVD